MGKRKKLIDKWMVSSLKWKIISIFLVLVLIGLTTRSILFTIIAWFVIIYFIVKIIIDLELF